jgi:hypothetical protein
MRRLPAIVLLLAGAACGESKLPGASGTACTELGCENGVKIDFSFTDRGNYLFEVLVDGSTTTCRAPLPLPREHFEACDKSEVFLGLVGSQLPDEQESSGGLTLPAATNASTITVRATRDGAPIGDKTFTPAYQVAPGPNGPECEPTECKLAATSFP